MRKALGGGLWRPGPVLSAVQVCIMVKHRVEKALGAAGVQWDWVGPKAGETDTHCNSQEGWTEVDWRLCKVWVRHVRHLLQFKVLQVVALKLQAL